MLRIAHLCPSALVALRFAALAIVFLLALPASAQESELAGGIAWSKDLTTAMEQAKKVKRPVMVCINAKFVEGRKTEEPAAKGLREVIYKDSRVVAGSKDFVCVMLTKQGDSKDYDALRGLGIDGWIVSPQHVFVNSAGDTILHRNEYWPHGSGDSAVKVLLSLMTRALEAAAEDAKKPSALSDDPDKKPPPTPAPEGVARPEWIDEQMRQLTADVTTRNRALKALVDADKGGDCTGPLIAALPVHANNVDILRSLIRVLGRPGLIDAALPISEHLKHKDPSIRANAAVSLEYIGNGEKKVLGALKKLAGKEKDEVIANHAYRALGRCGVEDSGTRALLLKKAGSAKSEFASYGPCIGLAYFEGDEKAARGVEKLLKKIGIPGGRRGGGTNTVKRGLLSWTLASIADPKSSEFVNEELIAKLKNVKAFWVAGLVTFYEAVADACDGNQDALAGVEAGVGRFVQFSRGGDLGRYGAEDRGLMDEARKDRDTSVFQPKGDNLLDPAN